MTRGEAYQERQAQMRQTEARMPEVLAMHAELSATALAAKDIAVGNEAPATVTTRLPGVEIFQVPTD